MAVHSPLGTIRKAKFLVWSSRLPLTMLNANRRKKPGFFGMRSCEQVAEFEQLEVVEVRHAKVRLHQAGDAVDMPAAVARQAVEAAGQEVRVVFPAGNQAVSAMRIPASRAIREYRYSIAPDERESGRVAGGKLGQPVAVAIRQVFGAGDDRFAGVLNADEDFRARAAGRGSESANRPCSPSKGSSGPACRPG